jgi:O-antigen ligase
MTAFARVQLGLSAVAWACIPLFPAFITLTNVAFPGVSVIPVPLAIGLMALMLAFAIVLLIWFAVMRGAGAPWPLKWPMLALLAASVIALLFGLNWRDGSVFVVILAMVVLWNAHIGRFAPVLPGYLRSVWWGFLISGTLACAAAIGMVLTRSPAELYRIANGRAVGTFVLPGELAGYCIFLVPIAYAIARTAQNAALRALAWSACVLGAITMVLTFSRTGWVGLAVAIGVLVAVRSPRGGLLRAAAVIAAALAVVLMFFNEHHNPSENYTRISIWQAAIGVINRFPLTGVGPFGFSKIYPYVRMPDGDATAFHAHSLYLTFFAELGIVGFLAFLWVLAAFARALVKRLQNAAAPSAFVALAIAAGVAGALVQGLIDTVSVVIFGLLFPMLALALAVAQSPRVEA